MSHTSRMSSLGASTELRAVTRTIFGKDRCTALAGRIGREYWAVGAVGSALPWHGRGHRFEPGTVHHPQIVSVSPSLIRSERYWGRSCIRMREPDEPPTLEGT